MAGPRGLVELRTDLDAKHSIIVIIHTDQQEQRNLAEHLGR